MDRTRSPVSDVLRAATEEILVSITADLDIVEARQRGRGLALQLGYSPMDATLIATAISELARNIVLYAGRGTVALRAVSQDGRRGIRIVACDEGPGIADPALAASGGYSTSGGLGLGLSGVRRLMDEFHVASMRDRGTTVTVTRWKR
ncbi:MAG TPA: ATP-binding protein [Gemmatimonadales bacterium]|nr:ATP-binding protein [Gemmatimonadales bacterium]